MIQTQTYKYPLGGTTMGAEITSMPLARFWGGEQSYIALAPKPDATEMNEETSRLAMCITIPIEFMRNERFVVENYEELTVDSSKQFPTNVGTFIPTPVN